ncbi:hypothetical protein BJ875DRAFT_225711 [Amylocarpus encephaloides]|uniref:Uncharacterized protein n=1 Tax=Amylocarpus encephaloides TaxID=45428 RepID=A0A9P7YMP6_9HELO|nr:hypothetical protein BJ875DRAFT_225711 [Amylocarpus encephaloides]
MVQVHYARCQQALSTRLPSTGMMTTAPEPAVANMPTPSQTAMVGADQLWKYQLRQENAALQEQIQALPALSTTLLEVKNFVAELATEVGKFKVDRQKMVEQRREDVARFDACLAEMQKKIGVTQKEVDELMMQRKRKRDDEQSQDSARKLLETALAGLDDQRDNVPRDSIPLDGGKLDTINRTSQERPPKVATREARRPSNRQAAGVGRQNTHQSLEAQPPRDSTETPETITSNMSAQRVEPSPIVQPPNTVVKSTKAKEKAPNKTPQKDTSEVSISQNGRSINDYLQRGVNFYSGYPAMTNEEDMGFANAWIQGLDDPQAINHLVDTLLYNHQSRTNVDGIIHVLCRWSDIEQGLIEAKMISAKDVEPQRGSGKRRRLDGKNQGN